MEEARINIPEQEKYIKLPYALFSLLISGAKKLSRAALFSLGKVFTFSRVKDEPRARCRFKMKELAKELHISERQTIHVVNALLKADLIERVKDGNGKEIKSQYRYIGDPVDNGYVRVDLYLLNQEFTFKDGSRRFLTLSEALVLSFMMTHCNNPKKRKFEGSIRSIANQLHVATSTVQSAVSELMSAHLITRPEEDTARNASRWSVYHVDERLIRKTEKEYKKALKDKLAGAGEMSRSIVYVPKSVADADARADRERYYAQTKAEAEAACAPFRRRLNNDPTYARIHLEKNRVDTECRKALLGDDPAKFARLERQKAELEGQLKARQLALRITDEQLRPKYRCSKCSDTGFKADGRSCDCYPGGFWT